MANLRKVSPNVSRVSYEMSSWQAFGTSASIMSSGSGTLHAGTLAHQSEQHAIAPTCVGKGQVC